MSSRAAGRHFPGPLAVVGGDEFRPGNEPADRVLVQAAATDERGRPAFIVASAAARQDPDKAVQTARAWFSGLGLQVEELQLRTRRQANSSSAAGRAREAGFVYLCGGDPGLTVRVLSGTAAWSAIVEAWRDGAVLAGSSAGAMALGEWTLIRARMPGDARREPRPALAAVPGLAVVPHFEAFGRSWLPSARAVLPADATIVGIDARTAALWSDGIWRVRGAGTVTVIRRSHEATFGDGEGIDGLPQPAGTG